MASEKCHCVWNLRAKLCKVTFKWRQWSGKLERLRSLQCPPSSAANVKNSGVAEDMGWFPPKLLNLYRGEKSLQIIIYICHA